MNYNNKRFTPINNSDNGEVDSTMIFEYQQQGQILTCTYSGGQIVTGHLIGLVSVNGEIDMRYHQVNQAGEINTGICKSTPEILADGRIRLYEQWQWTSGDKSQGESILEEI